MNVAVNHSAGAAAPSSDSDGITMSLATQAGGGAHGREQAQPSGAKTTLIAGHVLMISMLGKTYSALVAPS